MFTKYDPAAAKRALHLTSIDDIPTDEQHAWYAANTPAHDLDKPATEEEQSKLYAAWYAAQLQLLEYHEWEDLVTCALEERLDVTRSDAQGMVEAKESLMKHYWSQRRTPAETAKSIDEASIAY